MMPINKHIPGQLLDNEMHAIELLARLVPEGGHIVEVGSLLGRSSWIWAKSAHPSVTVNCIDPWELGGGGNFAKLAQQAQQRFTRSQFLRNVADCKNIVALQGFSPDAFSDWDQPIDLYFEDAVHANPIFARNLAFWSSHLQPSGVLCGHDFIDRFADVQSGALSLASDLGRTLRVVETLWFILPEKIERMDDAAVREAVAGLEELSRTVAPGDLPIPVQVSYALHLIRERPPFTYEIFLDTALPLRPTADGILRLRGRIRNTSGHAWKVRLTPECYLEMGTTIVCDGHRVSSERMAIAGNKIEPGELVPFDIDFKVKGSLPGSLELDLLYRHAVFFSRIGGSAVTLPIC